ncbi:protein of unknown function [Burkholderia multivorans]
MLRLVSCDLTYCYDILINTGLTAVFRADTHIEYRHRNLPAGPVEENMEFLMGIRKTSRKFLHRR